MLSSTVGVRDIGKEVNYYQNSLPMFKKLLPVGVGRG